MEHKHSCFLFIIFKIMNKTHRNTFISISLWTKLHRLQGWTWIQHKPWAIIHITFLVLYHIRWVYLLSFLSHFLHSFPFAVYHYSVTYSELCVCVSHPQWDSHDRGRWVRDSSQSEMCRSLFPVLNGKHSPAIHPRMSEELLKCFSWDFSNSLFT